LNPIKSCILHEITESMFTAIRGYYEKGNIVLKEKPPIDTKTEVIVTFITEDNAPKTQPRRKPGGLSGKVTIPDNFNEPLEDMRDYQ